MSNSDNTINIMEEITERRHSVLQSTEEGRQMQDFLLGEDQECRKRKVDFDFECYAIERRKQMEVNVRKMDEEVRRMQYDASTYYLEDIRKRQLDRIDPNIGVGMLDSVKNSLLAPWTVFVDDGGGVAPRASPRQDRQQLQDPLRAEDDHQVSQGVRRPRRHQEALQRRDARRQDV